MHFGDFVFPSTHFLAISSSDCMGYLCNLNNTLQVPSAELRYRSSSFQPEMS